MIRLLKSRSSPNTNTNNNSITDLCNQLENLNSSLNEDTTLDPSLMSNLTISIYKNVHL